MYVFALKWHLKQRVSTRPERFMNDKSLIFPSRDCLVKNRAPNGMCQTHSYALKGNLNFLRAGLRQQL